VLLLFCAFAADVLVEDSNGDYYGGVEEDWSIAFVNGQWWKELNIVTSPPKAQKFAIYVGEVVLPGDSGIWYGSGSNAFDLRNFAPDIDPTKPWSLTCNVYGHNDGAFPDEPPGTWWCEFQVLGFSNAKSKEYGWVYWTSENNDTWQQITFHTEGSESGDTQITLVLAVHWGAWAEPVNFESFVIFDDIWLTYTPLSGDVEPPGQIANFTAKRWDGAIELFWQNPSDSDFAGTLIRARTDHFPVSKTDGELVADIPGSPGSQQSFMHEGLENGVTYYYAAYAYDNAGNYSEPVTLATSPHPGLITPQGFLTLGWNMIGSIRETPVLLRDCFLTDGKVKLTFQEAVDAGWVQPVLYYYDGSTYRVLSISGGDDEYLRPWYGYWLLTFRDSLSLIVPAP